MIRVEKKAWRKRELMPKTTTSPFWWIGRILFSWHVQLVNCFFFRFLVVCFPQTATLQTQNFAASVFCCFHSCSEGWYIFVEFIQLKNIFMFIIVIFYFQYISIFFWWLKAHLFAKSWWPVGGGQIWNMDDFQTRFFNRLPTSTSEQKSEVTLLPRKTQNVRPTLRCLAKKSWPFGSFGATSPFRGYCHHGSFRLGPDGHPFADGHRRRQGGERAGCCGAGHFQGVFHFFVRRFPQRKKPFTSKTNCWFHGSLPSCFFFMFFFQVLFAIYIAANHVPRVVFAWKGDLLRSFTSFTGRLDDGHLVAPLSPTYPIFQPENTTFEDVYIKASSLPSLKTNSKSTWKWIVGNMLISREGVFIFFFDEICNGSVFKLVFCLTCTAKRTSCGNLLRMPFLRCVFLSQNLALQDWNIYIFLVAQFFGGHEFPSVFCLKKITNKQQGMPRIVGPRIVGVPGARWDNRPPHLRDGHEWGPGQCQSCASLIWMHVFGTRWGFNKRVAQRQRKLARENRKRKLVGFLFRLKERLCVCGVGMEFLDGSIDKQGIWNHSYEIPKKDGKEYLVVQTISFSKRCLFVL